MSPTATVAATIHDAQWDGFNLRDDASGASLILSKLDGNADPTIGFGLLGITGASPAAFSATFSIPVDLVGPILAQSNASYTVTRLGTTPSTLSPSHAFTVTSQDTNSNTGDDINKGVDIGDTFIVAAPKIADTITFPSTTSFKENVFVAPAGTDLFSVEVAFTLTKDTSASVTGVVHQTAVPEPSTYGLLAAGLAFVGFMTRRRLSA